MTPAQADELITLRRRVVDLARENAELRLLLSRATAPDSSSEFAAAHALRGRMTAPEPDHNAGHV